MSPPTDIDVLATKFAGVLGALVSLRFINGTWPEKLLMTFGGVLLSLYASPWAAQKTELPEGLCGFLFGMFGMAIMAKVWEAIQVMPVNEFWTSVMAWIKSKLS